MPKMASIKKTIISTPNCTKPIGPYSQAVLVDRTLYVSGVLGIDKDGNKPVTGGAACETRKALTNLGYVLEAAGSKYENVVKTTIFLKDINDFTAVNKVYAEFFKSNYPARSTYQVANLPVGASVEIEVIALVGSVKTEHINALGSKL